jgi:hypothetical protein
MLWLTPATAGLGNPDRARATAGPVHVTVTGSEVACGEAPVLVPTTAVYVWDSATLLVTVAVHVFPDLQGTLTELSPARITRYKGVSPTSPLVSAVRVTEVPAGTFVALASSVTDQGTICTLMPVTSDELTGTGMAEP